MLLMLPSHLKRLVVVYKQMNTPNVRPCFAGLYIAIFLGIIAIFPSLSAAQEQTEVKRKIVSQVVPVYPELAKKMQITGVVKMEVVVAPNGKTKSTQVVGGSPVFVKAATEAVEKWKWGVASQDTKELVELDFHP